MVIRHYLLLGAFSALVGSLLGCATNDGAMVTPAGSTGGFVNATGGAFAQTGGSSTAETGGMPGVGGSSDSCCSSCSCTTYPTSGGASPATGGAANASGGKPSSTGGAAATGGKIATGGSNNSAGGTNAASGGTDTTIGGSGVTGGTSAMTGGTSATGGALSLGGSGTGGATSIDPAVSTAISACMDKLPYGGNLLSAEKREPIITAIVNTCAAFAPPGAEWQTYCQMFLVAAINAESSYDDQAGTKGAGTDPTVGLMQIRFSSVVRDIADYGPVNTLKRIGCDFGTVTESDSYATKSAMMLDVTCNIAIATWYYFIFGSGNGGSTAVWVWDYCSGGGVAGNLHIGMASFLMGGEAAHSSLSGADWYYNEVKGWFDPCVTYSGTHPFELTIQPDRKKYCR